MGILKAFNNPTEKTADEDIKRQVKGSEILTDVQEQYSHLVAVNRTACLAGENNRVCSINLDKPFNSLILLHLLYNCIYLSPF